MLIREVTSGDAARIADIYNHYIGNTVITFETARVSVPEMEERINEITGNGFPYIVAEIDGKVAGYCYAHPWKTKAAYSLTWETTIYLKPDSCHKGTGRVMMEELIKLCRQRGAKVLIACITGDNTESMRFHESLGFMKVSHFHNVGYKHGRYLDVIDFELQL